ncbi:ABC transporter permease [Humidesulfovibrio idahonensis]
MRLASLLDLLFYQARANLRAEISRLYLNFVWWVLEPCITMAIYYVVFGIFMNHTTKHFSLFLLIGTTQWQWFSATLSHSTPSIQAASELMQHVDIPKIVFPLEIVIRDCYKHVFVLLLMGLLLAVYPIPLSTSWLALPLITLVQGLCVMAAAITLAACCPFLPDLPYIVSAVLNVMVFISGVFFDVDSFVLPQHRYILYLNPMAGLIREYRRVILDGQWPDWTYLATVALGAGACLLASVQAIKRFDRVYPRICQQ